jgi:hypothetical protein
MLCRRRWRSSVLNCKTLPGADCGSDHQLVIADIKIKLKKINRQAIPARFSLERENEGFRVEVSNRFADINLIDREPEELWQEVKTAIKDAAEQHVPRLKRKRKAPWLSPEAIRIAEERRAAKGRADQTRVSEMNKAFQRQVRKDKEKWLNEECRSIEDYQQRGKAREFFRKIREITGEFQPRMTTIRGKEGTDLMMEQEIKERWREYTEELYQNESPEEGPEAATDWVSEPPILEDEVWSAMQEISNRKAPGDDGIPAELLKMGSTAIVKAITALCNEIWAKTTWPKDWKKSVYIPIYKKGDKKDCGNYRTIALISHASKILLKIIQKRIEPALERELAIEQAGFRRNRGTRDHIANLRWIMEVAREYKRDLYLCFIDYSKAFDCVEHSKLWHVLRDMGIPEHITILLRNLYDKQEAVVRTEAGDTEPFGVGKGVRQGCILSPYLFNLYSENIMRGADLEEAEEGIRIGGRKVNNLRYADDTTLMAETEEDLRSIILKIKEKSEQSGLLLNIKKTKIMSTTNLERFTLNDEEIEVVDNFTFLGVMIRKDGECEREIYRRIAMGKAAMSKLLKIMKDRDITRATKIRMVKALVYPVMMYGCETWTIRKKERKRIDSFELWCWRRLLRIPWTARRTNRSILDEIMPGNSLEALIVKQRLTYFGHVIRADSSMEKMIMTSKMEGRRGRGRPRMRWLDGVKEATGKSLRELISLARDRRAWRAYAHEVTRSRKRLDGTD